MTAIVLDASVAVKLVSQELDSDTAVDRVAAASFIVAPDLIIIEVLHALWKKDHGSTNAIDRAQAAINALGQMIDRLVPTNALIADAVSLSHGLPHPVYDCLYLALGRIEDAPVLTADAKFASAIESAGYGSKVERLKACLIQ